MKLSIITINYNHKEGLLKTIKSVVNQTYHDIEYIVIDGGSTDGSVDVVKQYEDSISYWVSEPDCGIYNAMNKGVAKATGEYCLFLNSGDSLHGTDSILEFVSRFAGEDLLMGRVMCMPSCRIAYDDIHYPLTLLDFYMGGPVPHPACLIRRALFDKHLYDEELRVVSDWKFFLQVIVQDQCSYKIVDTVVSDFEEGGISSNRQECNIERENVLRELLPPAILLDYKRFENGSDYCDDAYDSFFSDLKKNNRRCANLIYGFSVLLLRPLSLIFRSLSFSRRYSLHIEK